ncbi:glutaredoxin family protein [Algibacter amylolyticus]|uniref:Glutaredoxin family protein n=1 Tax=Algibacter amylolyticus TaxID=1608400 RepID=A0A5M7BKE2_9FLAO|nr:glutaredoxin domain-containing protein [Algibacter amylolyticus]KAA5827781.1 glutaredoxin family protein [Algibacter amylolyticus]MBB5267008.1 glutaredoxin [Algibacter amylolyticus]TSJ82026.1 glutaredoxin family protein [Algibacter amylolyticus]
MKAFIFSILLIITLGEDCLAQKTEPGLNGSLTAKENLKKIIVYGSDTCHYCIDTKAYLKSKKIDFTYYDVDVNLLKQREMVIKLQKAGISLDNLSLPIVDLYGKLIMNNTDFEDFLKKLDTTKN